LVRPTFTFAIVRHATLEEDGASGGMTPACSKDSQNRMGHEALIDFFCRAEDEALGALRRLPI
jgi:hypothetical protein